MSAPNYTASLLDISLSRINGMTSMSIKTHQNTDSTIVDTLTSPNLKYFVRAIVTEILIKVSK